MDGFIKCASVLIISYRLQQLITFNYTLQILLLLCCNRVCQSFVSTGRATRRNLRSAPAQTGTSGHLQGDSVTLMI